MQKICTKCGEEKLITDFNLKKSSSDGYNTRCKSCLSELGKIYHKEWYSKNKESVIKNSIDYANNHREKVRESSKKHRLNNLEEERLRARNHYENNKDKKKEYAENRKDIINNYVKEYRKANKEKISMRRKIAYDKLDKNLINVKRRDYYNGRIKSDVLFQLRYNIKTMVRDSFRRSEFKRDERSIKILGCTLEEFKIHLESKFKPWMNWENKGLYNGQPEYGWDIDHIIPISRAKTKEEIISLNHYTNLQPLCSYYNRVIKRDN
jgi:hypothetical protein